MNDVMLDILSVPKQSPTSTLSPGSRYSNAEPEPLLMPSSLYSGALAAAMELPFFLI